MSFRKDSDALYEDYLAMVSRAQRSCSEADWISAGQAWSAWLAEYRHEKRDVLVKSALAEQADGVIDITNITGA